MMALCVKIQILFVQTMSASVILDTQLSLEFVLKVHVFFVYRQWIFIILNTTFYNSH